MTPDELTRVVDDAIAVLRGLVDEDWSLPAGTLEWSCRRTVDHTVDCVFSYALQVAARAEGGFLPFTELHALDEAASTDLVHGLGAVSRMLVDLLRVAPEGTVASDGRFRLGVEDWCARAAYEIALHTFDVTSGLGVEWRLPDELCRAIVASDMLWMFDRAAATAGGADADPWEMLLAGSGRTRRP